MKIKAHPAKLYYLVLFLAVVSQAIFTVVRLGQTVCYQDRINQLQAQKNQLIKNSNKLDQKLGSELSLVATQNSLQPEFEPIKQPIVIDTEATVALR
jgi:hypothetical protein